MAKQSRGSFYTQHFDMQAIKALQLIADQGNQQVQPYSHQVAWEEDSSDESPDEWEFAERGPLAKLRAKNQGETAKERAALGFYVDEAEYGDEYDFSDVAMWKKAIGNDPDFIGPESYPRRMRDSHGTSIYLILSQGQLD